MYSLLTESVHRVSPILVNATTLTALHVENNSVSYKLHNGYSTLKSARIANSDKKARHACPSGRIISTHGTGFREILYLWFLRKLVNISTLDTIGQI